MNFFLRMAESSLRLLSRLPLWWLYRLSDLLFPIIYHLVRYRRKVVRENLRNAFPERSASERKAIGRQFYRFFCDYAFETIKLLTISPEEMRRRMKFYGTEEMDALLLTHPFCFMMVAHYGNWEWISTFAQWSPNYCAQLYKPLHNHTFDKIFLQIRSRFGSECINKKDILRHIAILRGTGTHAHIGFIADQSPSGNSIHDWMDFLNQDTPIFTGAERIGKRVDAAAVFAHVTRPRRGYYECHLEPLADSMKSFPDYKFSELFMRRVEKEINDTPHLWLWTHRRWKHKR